MLQHKIRSILLLVMAASTCLAVLPVAAADTPVPRRGWRVPSRHSSKANAVSVTPESINLGKALYMRECASCHGNSGLGDGPSVSELDVPVTSLIQPKVKSQTDGALYWKLTVGRKPMPGYRKLLDNNERWHLVNYIRSLGEQENAPEKSENAKPELENSGTQ